MKKKKSKQLKFHKILKFLIQTLCKGTIPNLSCVKNFTISWKRHTKLS